MPGICVAVKATTTAVGSSRYATLKLWKSRPAAPRMTIRRVATAGDELITALQPTTKRLGVNEIGGLDSPRSSRSIVDVTGNVFGGARQHRDDLVVPHGHEVGVIMADGFEL